ncbi:MAG: lytic transglycosylase domain-containing protein [Spongiibacteraceae bacterium]|jgi:soluble lytic murein transglycosylase-like protein|nr:lytic transglycosylase domain-containing protein [Spongiibacteraceae bacterium]
MLLPSFSSGYRCAKLLRSLVLWCSLLSALPAAAAGLPNETERAELRTLLTAAIAEADSFEDRFDAEVWLLAMSTRLARFMPDAAERLELLRHIHREARRVDLKPDLVLALIQVESRFDRFAVSRAGAQGLMQVMPFWKQEIGRSNDNLTDVVTNLRYGCQILKYYLDREQGNWTRALARYNGSSGQTWYPERVFTAWDYWHTGDL